MPSHPSAKTPPRPHTNYRFPQDPGITLACPVCRKGLLREEQRFVCRGAECRRAYLIRDGIPLLLESEATVLPQPEWKAIPGV
jgi:uncharacterized protein YbaR (Trm112 family)